MTHPPRGTRRLLVWTGQLLLAGIVAVFVWRTLEARWEEFRSIDLAFTLQPGWIGLSAGLVLATYGILVEAWRRVLRGWGQSLGFLSAARIWTLSNLGRYVPGKIWSIAGLTVLARRAHVAAWPAAGSALVMQAMAAATGMAVVAATAPGVVSPVWLGSGAAIAIAAVVVLSWPRAVRALATLAGRPEGVVPLSRPALAAAAGVAALSWVSYGLAFWCLARGLLGDGAQPLTPATAIGIFAGGYIAGLIALFAPGGIGVREAVFVGLLTPSLGAGGAVALTAGSRVLLTLTEVGAAFLGLLVHHDTREQGIA